MSIHVTLDAEDDWDGWRSAARSLDSCGIEPADVVWSVGPAAGNLFASLATVPPPVSAHHSQPVPAAFLSLARLVAIHDDPQRFSLLYRMLRRLRAERNLLRIASDSDVVRALRMAKEVRRDLHKMKAFVRFRLVTPSPETYAAWFEPSHHSLRAAAPFFMKRFAGMRWSILTPRGAAYWDGKTLRFGPPVSRDAAPKEDHLEEFWRTYYASIFNPARLKPKAMQAEMPKKYWKNLPEASLIIPLMRNAEERLRIMVAALPTVPLRRAPAGLPEASPAPLPGVRSENLEELAAKLGACQRCSLCGTATQVVPGEGAAGARLMIVGEQPGDEEDLAGRPFIGPAGRVFDAALERAGASRSHLFVTNAVKHFKFTPRGRRRIHERPNTSEVAACHGWLEEEVSLVRPKLVLAMGASAVRSLTGASMAMGDVRGQIVGHVLGAPIMATYHPSYLLRLSDEVKKREAWRLFRDDIAKAATLAKVAIKEKVK